MKRIYLDHSATTPIRPEVAEIMYEHIKGDNFGNPTSLHWFGRKVRKSIDEAREKVAKSIGANAREIVFTSGGTEADNMAIHGVAMANKNKGNHIITTAVEHHAVLNTVKALGKQGFTITILPVDKYGLVRVEDVSAAITDKTILITIMHANNEVGTVMPIEEIGAVARSRGILFHTDAVQSFGKIPVDVNKLGVDLLTISGHKIHGPKGIGALYIKRGTKWKQSLFHGGGQEGLKRAGTENVPGILGLGLASELAAANLEKDSEYLKGLRNKLIKEVLEKIDQVELTGHPIQRLPNHASFTFRFIEGESMLLSLDMKGIAASSGSACTSGSLEPSHVLLAMGIPHEIAHGSLRITLGIDNNHQDIECFIREISVIVDRLRAMSPLDSENEFSQSSDCVSCKESGSCNSLA
jgi:cysteine desulfurase